MDLNAALGFIVTNTLPLPGRLTAALHDRIVATG
jgi:hypothetical protein